MSEFKDLEHKTAVELFDLAKKQQNELKLVKKERDDLLAANTAMDRERNQYRDQVTVYKQRMAQAGGLIAQYFKLRLDEPEMTIKAIQNSLIGHGEP